MRRTELARSKKPIAKKRGTSTAKLKRDALKAWGAWIHARDQHCQRCGKSDGKLDAHHMVIRNFAATCTDEDNGVLLCFKCHGLMHSDPLEALKFYTRILGVDGYEKLRQKAYDGQRQTIRAAFWKSETARLSALLEGTQP